ncbi:carbon monoxide dehydrogenase [Rubrobacter tropicus]|uniref:Carbon monoxide dehydrogenase n=1 Tax=Rubrobacter tropicus TaxID=2653851 RepID=A0A6G8QEZ9_9ACTN|nr:SRPBCC family protein [Rubrobacter tropicus]QIN84817.1 carbon monoxide dehydrogenase [Rubrobacter tropicus]
MKINNEFTVSAPIEEAWKTMLDLEKIAPCLPGAAIQEEKGDGEYNGTMKVKIGPITASYKGTVKFEETDEANHRAVLQATGRDARGQGTASATIVSKLQEEGANTKVNVETDMKLTGRAAQFGRGIAQDVATKMLDQFAACLEQEISGGGAAAEAAAPVEPASGNGSQAAAPDGQAPPAAGAGGTAGRIISSEDPAVAAGGTVEGAVVAGSSEAAASAPTTGAQQPTTQGAPRRGPAEEPEAFDLGAASQGAILKRLGPVLAGAGVLFVLIWLFRRKR